jgi:hypothetical protein
MWVPRAGADATAAPSAHSRGVDRTPGLVDGFPPASSRLNAVHARATGLPTWNGSFVSPGKTYGYTMVRTDPAAGSATTNVPDRIRPLRLSFVEGGITLDDTDVVTDIGHSSILGRRVPKRTDAIRRRDAKGFLLE